MVGWLTLLWICWDFIVSLRALSVIWQHMKATSLCYKVPSDQGIYRMYTRLAKCANLIHLLMNSGNFTMPGCIIQLVQHIYCIKSWFFSQLLTPIQPLGEKTEEEHIFITVALVFNNKLWKRHWILCHDHFANFCPAVKFKDHSILSVLPWENCLSLLNFLFIPSWNQSGPLLEPLFPYTAYASERSWII